MKELKLPLTPDIVEWRMKLKDVPFVSVHARGHFMIRVLEVWMGTTNDIDRAIEILEDSLLGVRHFYLGTSEYGYPIYSLRKPKASHKASPKNPKTATRQAVINESARHKASQKRKLNELSKTERPDATSNKVDDNSINDGAGSPDTGSLDDVYGEPSTQIPKSESQRPNESKAYEWQGFREPAYRHNHHEEPIPDGGVVLSKLPDKCQCCLHWEGCPDGYRLQNCSYQDAF